MRLKHIHIFNLPAVANFMFKLAFSALDPKMKDRVSIHANLKEFLEIYEEHDILPKEYGGKIPWLKNNEMYKEKLRKNQEKLLAMDDQYIESDINKIGCGESESFSGSFRKLEID